jgi:hypothetical protein
MDNRTRIAVCVALLILIALTSCLPEKKIALEITKIQLFFPSAYYTHVIYLDNHVIGFSFDVDADREKSIFFAHEGDKSLTLFQPELGLTCTMYGYFEIVNLLPDGRLGLLKHCVDKSGATIYLSTERSVYAYDWNTNELEKLVEGKLAGRSNVWGYTWNPDMTLGVLETRSQWQGTLSWIDRDGEKLMDVEIQDRGLAWNLKDWSVGVERAGMADTPAWSPDGKTIAFFATAYGILEEPLPKYNFQKSLFFMNAETLVPEIVIQNIASPWKLYWSPNSQFLLFSGCYGINLTCGLWRYDVINKTLSLIDEGASFSDFTWITNDKVVAIKEVEKPFGDNQIWEYSITE